MLSHRIIEIACHSEGEFILTKEGRPSQTYSQFNLPPVQMFRYNTYLTEQNCYMASLDIKDAYYSVAVDAADGKFLRFIWKGVYTI